MKAIGLRLIFYFLVALSLVWIGSIIQYSIELQAIAALIVLISLFFAVRKKWNGYIHGALVGFILAVLFGAAEGSSTRDREALAIVAISVVFLGGVFSTLSLTLFEDRSRI